MFSKGNLASGASHTFELIFSIWTMATFYLTQMKLDTILQVQLEPDFWICYLVPFSDISRTKLSCSFLLHFQENLKTKNSPSRCIGPKELKIEILHHNWTPFKKITRFYPWNHFWSRQLQIFNVTLIFSNWCKKCLVNCLEQSMHDKNRNTLDSYRTHLWFQFFPSTFLKKNFPHFWQSLEISWKKSKK